MTACELALREALVAEKRAPHDHSVAENVSASRKSLADAQLRLGKARSALDLFKAILADSNMTDDDSARLGVVRAEMSLHQWDDAKRDVQSAREAILASMKRVPANAMFADAAIKGDILLADIETARGDRSAAVEPLRRGHAGCERLLERASSDVGIRLDCAETEAKLAMLANPTDADVLRAHANALVRVISAERLRGVGDSSWLSQIAK
jgi:hypothetical protein